MVRARLWGVEFALVAGLVVVIRRLSNLADEFVRAVFARVNRVNMVLTEQELRNALLPGPFIDFLKDCEDPARTRQRGFGTSWAFSSARSRLENAEAQNLTSAFEEYVEYSPAAPSPLVGTLAGTGEDGLMEG